MKRENYKYRLNQKVEVKTINIAEKKCDNCGHIEEIFSYPYKKGVIAKRSYEHIYSYSDYSSIIKKKVSIVKPVPYYRVKVGKDLIGVVENDVRLIK